jgi:ATP-binding cassette subfamily B protein
VPEDKKTEDMTAEEKKAKEKKTKVPFGKVVRFGVSTVMKTIPAFFILINIVGILHGVSYGFATLFTQRFYESVEDVLTKASAGMGAAYVGIIALGLIMLAREILNGVHNFMHNVWFQKMEGEFNKLIHAKMGRIDPICLEDTRMHDDINKAQEGSGTIQVIIGIGGTIFTFYLPYFIFMGAYFYYLKPLFIVCLVLVFIPTLAGQLMRTNIIEKFEDKAAPIRREMDAHEQAITHKTFFKETRLLGGYTFFLNLFLDTVKKLGKAEWEANRKTNLINLTMNIFTILGHGGVIWLLFDALLKGEISIGAFAAVYGSIGLLFSIMREIIQQHIGNIASNLGKAHNFIRFMELPERGGQPNERDPRAGIVVEGAGFRYPNATEDSLTDINLRIRTGETVAIVGENGAGKTTLARLLTGIYKPTSGKVTVYGMDTADTDATHLFKDMSGVFQKYQRYWFTLYHNISISDADKYEETVSTAVMEKGVKTKNRDAEVSAMLLRMDRRPKPAEALKDAEDAAKAAGVEVEGHSFPNGMDTMLTRELEGVDLSGGEWQRVAIARGLYRTHDAILLDEPTAAIDPLEESRLYKQFIDMSRNKTAIIITHRLGSTQIADRVLVMEKGRIVGDGTHESLLRDCPLYKDMYAAQAEWYQDREG